MKLKAKDTLHISSLGPDPIRPGEEFDLPDPDAKKLLDRGLVSKVASKPKKKTASKPKNKAAPKSKNKSAS